MHAATIEARRKEYREITERIIQKLQDRIGLERTQI